MSEETDSIWDEEVQRYDTFRYLAHGLRVFASLVAVERRRLLLAVSVVAAIQLMEFVLPLVVRTIVDYGPAAITEGLTLHASMLLALLAIVYVGIPPLERFIQEPAFARALVRLENYWPVAAHKKLLELSLGYHLRENTGKKIARVSKGIEKLLGIVMDSFWGALPALIFFTLNAIIALWLDWRLGLILVVPVIPAFYLHVKAFERYRPQWVECDRIREESVGIFCQSILNIRTVQAYVAETVEASTHECLREAIREKDEGAAVGIQKYLCVVEEIIRISFIATIIIGLYFVYHGWSTFGTVTYLAFTGSHTLQCLWVVVMLTNRMARNLIAAERMYTLLNQETDVRNEAPGVVPEVARGTLAFEDVTFHYPSKEQPTLEHFDLEVTSGEMLALVGPSGAGKSSLAALLLRAYDPTGGAVTLDGQDIRAIDRDWYRRRFAYVPQDVEIFDGTIRENVVYAAPHASEGLVRQALQAACLDEALRDAAAFPLGIETQVGERGVQLSGGQKQRVGIARAYIALLSGAEVLVLDEATSNLDSESEQVVQHFIGELRRDRSITIVVIAHRLSTIKAADRICVLDHGRIAELGTHEQLLKCNGLYQRLVALQQLGELE